MNMTEREVVPGFFWADRGQWLEAHQSLDLLFEKYGSELQGVRDLARQARDGLDILAPMFDRFAGQVCPGCATVCCFEARVAYDFRDLVFMHALEMEPPPHQLRRNDREHCRYLDQTGCLLPRILRPFVCTWYYCAPMLELFYQMPARTQRRMSEIMTGVQTDRKKMEEEFIKTQTRL